MSIWAELRSNNVSKAVVHFDGGNDDGGVNYICLTYKDGTTKEIPFQEDWEEGGDTMAHKLVEAVYRNYDFQGEPCVVGTLTYITDTQDADWDVEENYEDDEDDDEDDEDDDEDDEDDDEDDEDDYDDEDDEDDYDDEDDEDV